MEGKGYRFGYKGALQQVAIHRYAILLLAIAVVVQTLFLWGERERVVLVPPIVDERMELGYHSANAPYYKAYALYVATFLGNINPSNASFVREGLSMSFSPELYNRMQVKITEDAERMRVSGRSLRFYADRVLHETETGKTFVTGKQEIVSAAGNVHDQDVTYEMEVVIRDGLPSIESFAYYTGAPHTEEWLLRNRHTVARSASE